MAKRKKVAKKYDIPSVLVAVPKVDKGGKYRGAPPAMTPTVLERLRQAYTIGCDDKEAALHAGIAVNTIYNYQKVNQAFLEWKEALKQKPFLTARKTIVDNLARDPEFALKYMERKKRAEFAPSAQIKITEDLPTLDDEQKAKVGNIMAQHMQKLAERQANG